MVRLDYLSHYGPSICVKFHQNLVLAGSGPFVHAYDYENGKLLNKSRIFHKNKVHGIAIKGDHVLAYGARSVSIITLGDILQGEDNSKYEKNCHEWIIHGEFSADGTMVFLLTCYNKVLCCDLNGRITCTKAVFGERAILYSGSIKVLDEKLVYVNAGTVMGGVIVWDLFSEKKLQNFTGHEGSIFYVTLSDNGKLAASCSDDRSIKLWNMKTGELLSTGWGHTARIWNLKFFDDDRNIISVSEDCTCRVWRILEDGTLEQKDIFEVHLTKNVWGVDVDSSKMIAVTSGNDGALKLTDLTPLERKGDEIQTFSHQDISNHGVALHPKENFAGFFWLKFGIVAVTSLGRIVRYNQWSDRWDVILNDRFASDTITNGIQDLNTIILCNKNCDLLLLKFSEETGELEMQKSIHVEGLSKCTNCLVLREGNRVLLTLESPNPSDPFLCIELDPNTLEILSRHQWKKPSNFSSSSLCIFDKFLLVGSRFSCIAIFDLSKDAEELPVLIRQICAGDTITSVRLVESSRSDEALFSVTNRDGFYLFISINFQTQTSKIVHSNKVSKGFLEGAFYNKSGDFIIYGFKSDFFYMFNETKQFEIMNEMCGGAHRQWRLLENFELDEFVLIYVKAGSLRIRRVHKREIPSTLVDGTHGREIRDISICGAAPFHGGYIFCTGSEDTTIKLNHFDRNSGCVKNYWTQRKHTSGLQHCKFLNDKYMISSAAREELFLWEVNTEFSSNPYMTVVQTLPPSSKNPDLRIMDFDYKLLDGSDDFILATVYSDSVIKIWLYDSVENKFRLLIDGKYETCCLLNVAFVSLENKEILLVAPTDGYLVYWDISEYVLPKATQVELLEKRAEDILQQLPKYDGRLQVHKAGIKDMDIMITSEHSFKAYTGGDDNGVAISTFSINATGKLTSEVTSFEERGGASTITSINMIKADKKVITTSVDQKIRMYDVSSDKLTLQLSSYTTIADTGSSALITESSGTYLLIGGIGLSLAKVISSF